MDSQEELEFLSANTNSDVESETHDAVPRITLTCFGDFSSTSPPKRYINKSTKSIVWKFFQIYDDKKLQHFAHCQLCKRDINYTKTKSTGMLTRHLRSHHRKEYESMLEDEAVKQLNSSSLSSITMNSLDKKQSSIQSFVKHTPSFEAKLLDWIIDTYQPLQACEHPSFRAMCQSLNAKAPVIGKSKVQNLLSAETALMRIKLKEILKGRPVSITTDAWTSCNNVTYMTCTAHWIHQQTWLLHHMPLGIFEKTGTSHAEDVVQYVTDILSRYDITYTDICCIVTDTEATMVKAGRIFCAEAESNSTNIDWHSCIDHLLNLVTKIAFKDYEESQGAMIKARDLVGHFSSSSQAENILLGKQPPGAAVKCIQDVTTRWWSTFTMCERLIRLRPYLCLMEAEGSLDKNLNDAQWSIIKDTTILLEPFMCAQKLLEGESYVTVSMIPFIIWKIRKGLLDAIESPNSSVPVVRLATLMNDKFREQWGTGDPGTVVAEHVTEGPRRRPKGIPKLVLVASFLDPRFKFGPGFSNEDKDRIWNLIRQMMRDTAVLPLGLDDDDNDTELDLDMSKKTPGRQQLYVEAMLTEITELAMVEQAEHHENDDANNNDDEVLKRVDAELLFYKREPYLPITKADRSFNNPLEWWRLKQEQYPLLAKIALKVLAIPATSAPSERVFSVAGITIAKERSRLATANAGELIFLHDIRPAIDAYERSMNNILLDSA